jgi:hypothetical protein
MEDCEMKLPYATAGNIIGGGKAWTYFNPVRPSDSWSTVHSFDI